MIERLKEESRKELKILYAAANSATSTNSSVLDGSVVKLTSEVLLRIVKRVNPTKPEHAINRLAKVTHLFFQIFKYFIIIFYLSMLNRAGLGSG